ncbi:DMT family transporter [Spongisporangium articulatum]|uniref:DMT family transporter n=1 Tax=Spongisporangium articulatum TaxID=3362603 RepID=A0ABW8AT33_9ACTN
MRSAMGRGVLALVGATLFWAGNYVLGKVAVETISPFSLTTLRWALALLPLIALAQAVERPDWRDLLRHWRFLTLQAATGLAGYTLFLYAALEHSTAFAASLINAANPALIAIAAAVLLHERLGFRGGAGILVAFVGVLVLLTHGHPTAMTGTTYGAGDVFMLGAIVAWTAYTVAARMGPKLPPISAVAVQAGLVTVVLGALVPVVGLDLPGTGPALWSLLFIVVFPSCGSYVLWAYALTVVPPARAGVFLNLITAFTAVAALVTGTPITAAEVVGGVIVLVGVTLTVRSPARAGT